MKFLSDDNVDTTKEEQEKLYEALTQKALTADHTSFEYIKNVSEFFIMRQAVSGLETVIKLYTSIWKSLYKVYCKQVLEGKADFNMLYVCKQNQVCADFYRKELDIAKDMLDEYWAYIWSGHFLDQWLFFRTRETWHLWDHREDTSSGN